MGKTFIKAFPMPFSKFLGEKSIYSSNITARISRAVQTEDKLVLYTLERKIQKKTQLLEK